MKLKQMRTRLDEGWKQNLAAGVLGAASLFGSAHSAEPNQPKPIVAHESPKINLKAIAQIESSNNPKAANKIGARGLYQFLPATWDDTTKRLYGKEISFDYAFDPEKATAVADYYYNKRIPQMLRHFKVPVNTHTVIAAYNWGIKHVKDAYEQYGDKWESKLPVETKAYIRKYESL